MNPIENEAVVSSILGSIKGVKLINWDDIQELREIKNNIKIRDGLNTWKVMIKTRYEGIKEITKE